MIRLIVLLTLASPVCAQFRAIDISFEGVGCASCIESLPSRMQRIRGVESAKVDGATGVLRLKLAEQNRVRLEQVRDAIEQDGTKVRKVVVTVAGVLSVEAGKWLLAPQGVTASYRVEADGAAAEPGRVEVEGAVVDIHGAIPLVIRAGRVRKVE